MKNSPGCSLRDIQRRSDLPFGSVSYHLDFLQKHGLLKKTADGNSLRFFTNDLKADDEKLLILLRQDSIRNIILFIFSHEHCTHQDIISAVKLSPSTVTWHLKKIIDSCVVREVRKGKYKAYSIAIPKERIVNLLIVYKESFLDKLVNGIIEMWERT